MIRHEEEQLTTDTGGRVHLDRLFSSDKLCLLFLYLLFGDSRLAETGQLVSVSGMMHDA